MISTLKRYGAMYRCSNCSMTQFELKPNCPWCGDQFSNYQSVLIENFKIREETNNESDLLRNYMAEESTL